MLISIKKVTTTHNRTSKLKNAHSYSRVKTVAVLQCDNCESLFEREQGQMDHRRVSAQYFHVCPNCNPKQFAQKKGVERRQFWNTPVDSDLKI